jgi:hypothetical protein
VRIRKGDKKRAWITRMLHRGANAGKRQARPRIAAHVAVQFTIPIMQPPLGIWTEAAEVQAMSTFEFFQAPLKSSHGRLKLNLPPAPTNVFAVRPAKFPSLWPRFQPDSRCLRVLCRMPPAIS